MDLNAALNTLIKTSIASQEVKAPKITPVGDRGDMLITLPDGTTNRDTSIPARQHQLLSVSEVGPFIEYHKEQRDADPVVYLSPDHVKIVLNDRVDSVRDDIAVCPLKISSRFSTLSGLAELGPIDQKKAIRLLKLVFAQEICVRGEALLAGIRRLKLVNDQQSRQGTVVNEIDGAADLPDSFTVTTRVFTDPSLQTKKAVRVQVELNPTTGTFEFIPLDTDVTRAIDDSLVEIKTLLKDCGAPSFIGNP